MKGKVYTITKNVHILLLLSASKLNLPRWSKFSNLMKWSSNKVTLQFPYQILCVLLTSLCRKLSLLSILTVKQSTIFNLLEHLWLEALRVTRVLQEGRSLLTHTAGGVHMEEVPSLERTSPRSIFLLLYALKLMPLTSRWKLYFKT